MFASKERDDKAVEEWTETELQNFLIEPITTARKQSFSIFIDALDEGSNDDVRSLLSFLQRLIQHFLGADVGIRVFLASRHYPHISIRLSLSIVLENQPDHNHDLEYYIQNQIEIDDELITDKVRYRIQEQSRGVFLWVVVVVTMLNKLSDQIQSLAAMYKKLDETPSDLQEIFGTILSEEDGEDIGACEALFRWVLFSKSLLSPIELYVAVHFRSSMDTSKAPAVSDEQVSN